MTLSEQRNEIDRLLAAYADEAGDQDQPRQKLCRIVAPSIGRFPKGGGRVIRDERELYDLLVG
jgi:hypothetical protein